MKTIEIRLTLECADDVPAHVVVWMAKNLAEHAVQEFADDYDPRFVAPAYEGPPVEGEVEWVCSALRGEDLAEELARAQLAEALPVVAPVPVRDDDDLPF